MSQKIAHAHQDGTPLLKIASDRVGLRRAFKALSFMAAWDVARSRLVGGGSLTLQQYADYWRESHGASYRHQANFREAFPGEQTPDRLLDLAAAQWDVRTGVKGLGAVELT